MLKKALILLIIPLAFGLSSCAFFKYLDGSSEKDMQSFSSGSAVATEDAETAELRNDLKRRETHVEILEERIALMGMEAGELAALREENAKLAAENKELAGRLSRATVVAEAEEDEDEEEEEAPLAVMDTVKEAPKIAAVTPPAMPSAIKKPLISDTGVKRLPEIKVLTGTGKLDSAEKMSRRLFKMGYEVRRIDKAPKKFARNTVFYAEGFTDEAAGITKSLGGGTIYKPLTWQSVFDIIVVTGTQP